MGFFLEVLWWGGVGLTKLCTNKFVYYMYNGTRYKTWVSAQPSLPHLATKLCLLICAWTKVLEKGPLALDVSRPIQGFF